MIHHDWPSCTPLERVLTALGDGVRPSGKGWVCQCPAHDDRKPSLSVAEGDDGRALLNCHAGCKPDDVAAALGLTMADLFPPSLSPARVTFNPPTKPGGKAHPSAEDAVASLTRRHGEPAGRWEYADTSGSIVGLVLRFDRDGGKDFRPIRRDPDGWRVGAMPSPRPLYRISEVVKAETVVVCEGEKAADAARDLGFTATTSAGGSASGNQTDWRPVAGKRVVILPDNDTPGRKYADCVAKLVTAAGAASVKVLDLPGLPEKGDIADWVIGRDKGEAAAELGRLIERATLRSRQRGEATSDDSRIELSVTTLSSVELKVVDWFWPGRFPTGMLSNLVARPKASKSLLTCDIAARVTRGLMWPDGNGRAPLGDVYMMAAEDDAATTIGPRLKAAGADLTRVHLIEGLQLVEPDGRKAWLNFDLSHVERIAKTIRANPNAKVLFVDPAGSFLGGKVDAHRDNEVRSVLAPLAQMARELNIAVILVCHTNKSSQNLFADDAILGSRAFSGIVRANWHLTRDPDDKKRVLFLPGGCTHHSSPGMAYSIRSCEHTIGAPPLIDWEPDPVDTAADDLIGGGSAKRGGGGGGGNGGQGGERKEAGEILRLLLADGPKPIDFIKEQTGEAFSWATVKRAKSDAGIIGKPESKTFEPGKPPRYWWGIGEDWQIPAPVEAQPAATPDLPLVSQGVEPLREEGEQKPGNIVEIPEEAQRPGVGEPVRSAEPARTGEAQPFEPARSGSTPQTAEPVRQTVGETRIPTEEAQHPCESRRPHKPSRGKKPKTAPPADPITDTDALLAAVHRAGWTPAQAVGWLTEQNEYVPGDDLTGTHGGQRRKLLYHLAGIGEREVSA